MEKNDAIRAARDALKDQLEREGPESFEQEPLVATGLPAAVSTKKETPMAAAKASPFDVDEDAGSQIRVANHAPAETTSPPPATEDVGAKTTGVRPVASAFTVDEDEAPPPTRQAVPRRNSGPPAAEVASAMPAGNQPADKKPAASRFTVDEDDEAAAVPVRKDEPDEERHSESQRPTSVVPLTTRAIPARSSQPAEASAHPVPANETKPPKEPIPEKPKLDFDREFESWQRDGLTAAKAEVYSDNAFLQKALGSLERLMRISPKAEVRDQCRRFATILRKFLTERGIQLPSPPLSVAPKPNPASVATGSIPPKSLPRPAMIPPAPVSSIPPVMRVPAPRPSEPPSIEVLVSSRPPSPPVTEETILAPASILAAGSSSSPSISLTPPVLEHNTGTSSSRTGSTDAMVEAMIAGWLSGKKHTHAEVRLITDMHFLMALQNHLARLEVAGVPPDLADDLVNLRRIIVVELCANGEGGAVLRDQTAIDYVEWLYKALPGVIDLESDLERKQFLVQTYEEIKQDHDRASRVNDELGRIVKEGSDPAVTGKVVSLSQGRRDKLIQGAAFLLLVILTASLIIWGYLPAGSAGDAIQGSLPDESPPQRAKEGMIRPKASRSEPRENRCRIVDVVELKSSGFTYDCSTGSMSPIDQTKMRLCGCTFK